MIVYVYPCCAGCIEAMTLDWFKDDVFQNNATHIHAAGFYNFAQPVRKSWGDLFRDAKLRGLTSKHVGELTIAALCSFKPHFDFSYLFFLLSVASLNPQYDASGMWEDIKDLCTYLDFLITNEVISLPTLFTSLTHSSFFSQIMVCIFIYI